MLTGPPARAAGGRMITIEIFERGSIRNALKATAGGQVVARRDGPETDNFDARSL
jgi:hypothetical protein